MSREYCPKCMRPKITCICQLSQHINNQIDVWILQHPSETKQAKGTATLTELSLINSRIIVGEDFSACEALTAVIADPNVNVLLLYPSAGAHVVEALSEEQQQSTILLVLDGTWKKAYKMYQMSVNLHTLPKVVLADNIISKYVIRKHHKPNDVSTLEACVHALTVLENNSSKYQPMLESFSKFNDFQLQLNKQHDKNN